MTAANYPNCLDKTLSYEGGYTQNPDDPGNWTGCAVGKGKNKGTYKGISACSYPSLDIANLSDQQVADIYKTDYWSKVEGDALPAGVDLCTFDSAVNSGPGKGVEWLQMAMGMPADQIDGAMGPITLEWVGNIDSPHRIVDEMCDDRLDFLRSLSTWPTFGAGWQNRVDDVRRTAHGMVDAQVPQPEPKPEPEPQEITITISIMVPAGVKVNVDTLA